MQPRSGFIETPGGRQHSAAMDAARLITEISARYLVPAGAWTGVMSEEDTFLL